MNKDQIKKKLEEIRKKSSLLTLANHRTLHEWVIVVPAEVDEEGITTRASQFEDRPEIGLIVGLGPDVNSDTLNVGDIVFFGQYSHTQITHEDITYLIMRVEDVYCVADE